LEAKKEREGKRYREKGKESCLKQERRNVLEEEKDRCQKDGKEAKLGLRPTRGCASSTERRDDIPIAEGTMKP
jgi:hypothetical protein